jgi:hypothetical protein
MHNLIIFFECYCNLWPIFRWILKLLPVVRIRRGKSWPLQLIQFTRRYVFVLYIIYVYMYIFTYRYICLNINLSIYLSLLANFSLCLILCNFVLLVKKWYQMHLLLNGSISRWGSLRLMAVHLNMLFLAPWRCVFLNIVLV